MPPGLPSSAGGRRDPGFVDSHLSFTNATAFSPRDTMPLGPRAKGLMIVQSLASLATLGLEIARAVKILG